MDNKIYTIEEINVLINLLKKNLNMDFYFGNLYLDEIKYNAISIYLCITSTTKLSETIINMRETYILCNCTINP